jgi:putative molybdopterin biosynthesis protein
VQLLGEKIEPADLVIIGSHCVGLDYLVGELQQRGVRAKAMYVGSMGGLAAAKRGECDVAGIHLMDPKTGEYNRHLLTGSLTLVRGYGRMQGVVFRRGDARFSGKSAEAAVAAVADDPDCVMVNRNAGSGTRVLVDRLLGERRPPGYGVQTKSHNAVAAAVQQHRADWGIAINTIAEQYGLDFIPLQEEQYDFVIPNARLERREVQLFRDMLADPAIRRRLSDMGFRA